MTTNDQLLSRAKPLDILAIMSANSLPGSTTLTAAIAAMQGENLTYACPQCVVNGSNTGVITVTPLGLTVVCPTCAGMLKTDVPYLAVGNSFVLLAINGINSVVAGSTLQLTATVAGGTWSSGTPNTATINSSSGLLTAVSAGSVTITYTVNSVSVTATITVTAQS